MDAVAGLLSKCIDLAKAKRHLRRDLFGDFVEPAFVDFESVHSDYLTTFRRYMDLLEPQSNVGFMSIATEVGRDALFSSGLRLKIYALFPLTHHSEIGSFIDTLQRYLKCANELDPSESTIGGTLTAARSASCTSPSTTQGSLLFGA
jgi:hypothetical protein